MFKAFAPATHSAWSGGTLLQALRLLSNSHLFLQACGQEEVAENPAESTSQEVALATRRTSSIGSQGPLGNPNFLQNLEAFDYMAAALGTQ